MSGDKKGSFGHELAHAYYFTCDPYRKEIDRILGERKHERAVRILRSEIKALGYCDAVIPDEIQAYCATGFPGAFSRRIKDGDIQRLVTEIGQVFAYWEKMHNG